MGINQPRSICSTTAIFRIQLLEAVSGLAVKSAPVPAERVLDGAMTLLLRPYARVLLFLFNVLFLGASLMAQVVKNLPPMREAQEMPVQSLDWKDPLEEGLATHSSILAQRTPWTEESGGLQSMGSQELDTTERTERDSHTHA